MIYNMYFMIYNIHFMIYNKHFKIHLTIVISYFVAAFFSFQFYNFYLSFIIDSQLCNMLPNTAWCLIYLFAELRSQKM